MTLSIFVIVGVFVMEPPNSVAPAVKLFATHVLALSAGFVNSIVVVVIDLLWCCD